MKWTTALLGSALAFGGAMAQAASPSAAHASELSASSDAKRDAAVEKHIDGLHATLKITADQEGRWSEVASTMRENAQDLDQAIDKRAAKAATATAIDDLNAYAEIAQVHASGVKRLSSAFSDLYSTMSDEQKRTADELFSRHGHDSNK